MNLLIGLPECLHPRSDSASRHIAWDGSDFEVFYPSPHSAILRCLELRAMEEGQVVCNAAARRTVENMARSAPLDADWRMWSMDGSMQPGLARTKASQLGEL